MGELGASIWLELAHASSIIILSNEPDAFFLGELAASIWLERAHVSALLIL